MALPQQINFFLKKERILMQVLTIADIEAVSGGRVEWSWDNSLKGAGIGAAAGGAGGVGTGLIGAGIGFVIGGMYG